MTERLVTTGSEENTSYMFCFLSYSLDRQPAPGTEPQPAALKKRSIPRQPDEYYV
jgi:hypothetical protein